MPKREVNKALKEMSEQANRNMNYRFVLEYLDKKDKQGMILITDANIVFSALLTQIA